MKLELKRHQEIVTLLNRQLALVGLSRKPEIYRLLAARYRRMTRLCENLEKELSS